MKTLDKIKQKMSDDIGIDLGTASTLVYVRDRGIVLNEPSVVALNTKTNQVVAVGTEAKKMLGKTPSHIVAVRPLVDGVISDFEVTEEMISYFINRAGEGSKRILGPRVVIGVPAGVTNVESRAVVDAALSAGAREVYVVEEPMAAAVGIRLPVHEPVGSMIIDIGGGTTDIAVISLGGVVDSKSLKLAGDKMNADIITYIREEFKLRVGEPTAEKVKMEVGRVVPEDIALETTVRGLDLASGLPREVMVTDVDIREAIMPSIQVLMEAAKEVVESTPPEVLSDIMNRGIFLTGGGALIKGLDKLLSDMLKIPVFVAADPLSAVARGTGVILEDVEKYRNVLINTDDNLSF